MTRMDRLILLINYLEDKEATTKNKIESIKSCRDYGDITNDEAIDLVTHYNLTK